MGLNPTSNLIIKKNTFKAKQLILHYFQVPALFWNTEKAPRGKKKNCQEEKNLSPIGRDKDMFIAE